MAKHNTFRTVDEWKSAIMTLPDNIFFDLVRSVLGNIKTPFSKQRLLDDLFNFLLREDIRKIISAYIDEQDRKVLTAVAFLDEPAAKDLEAFFAGEYTPAELHAIVINLEERLILYRLRSEHAKEPLRLALNPVLKPVLAPLIDDIRLLFMSYKETVNDAEEADQFSGVTFRPDDRTMAALLAFIQGEEELFKIETALDLKGARPEGRTNDEAPLPKLRKKVLDEAKKVFPNQDLELAIRIFLRLGLVQQKGRGLSPCNGKISGFSALSAAERREYWAAALYLCLDEPSSGAHNHDVKEEFAGLRFSWNWLRRIASYIHSFRGFINPGRRYPENILRRLWELLLRDNAETNPLFSDSPRLPFEELLSLMEKSGFLVKTANSLCNANLLCDANLLCKPSGKDECCWKAPGPVSPRQETAASPVIVMDAALSFVLYPEIAFSDASSLAAFCSVKESAGSKFTSEACFPLESLVHFELTRQSVVRGFDQGVKANAMIALLERLSLNRLDANLGWTLREWENRYIGVALYQGIVLVLEEDRRYLAEAKPISRLILKTLAPGVYLLSSDEKAEAARALLKAGVDIVAQPPISKEPGWDGFSRNAFTRLGLPKTAAFALSLKDLDWDAAPQLPGEAPAAASIKQDFRRVLDKTAFTKPEKDELIARIERRLILSDAQLDGASLRYEKLEARGLDYAGKSTIAKQAVDAGHLVEVSWPGPEGELKRTVGIAEALEKKEGDSIFVFRSGGNSENDAIVFRVPLGKISLLRRIKQSIFEE